MELEKVRSPFDEQMFIWRIRLQIWWQNFRQFVKALSGHPLALAGGILVALYILAALFADQYPPFFQVGEQKVACWIYDQM